MEVSNEMEDEFNPTDRPLPSEAALIKARAIVQLREYEPGKYALNLFNDSFGVAHTFGNKWKADTHQAAYVEAIAATLDDHTAALRAEVEALRARVGEMVHALELEQQSAAQQGERADNYSAILVWQTRDETYKRAIEIIKSR